MSGATGYDQMADVADVAVIGGNFAGMSAALYLLRAQRRVVLFDDGLHRNRFAAASHGLLGQDGVAPDVIKARGLTELRAYPTLTEVAARVEAVTAEGGGFRVRWPEGAVMARRVILASGMRDLLPQVPGLAECWGQTAITCPYCHGFELKGRVTGVLPGESEMGGHYIRQVRRWAGELVVLDDGMTLAAPTEAVVAELGLRRVGGRILAVEQDGGQMRAVTVAGGGRIELGALYLKPPAEAAAPFAADLGCAMVTSPMGDYVEVDGFGRTSVPGAFAAGDLARPMPAAIFAAASGAAAGLGCDMDLAGLLA